MGLGNGEIRVCRVNKSDETDLSDFWSLPMHDKGRIFAMKISPDEKMLFTCGEDGNLFSFCINVDEHFFEARKYRRDEFKLLPRKTVQDIEDENYPTLQEIIVKEEQDRILEKGMTKKNEKLGILRYLTEEYQDILRR